MAESINDLLSGYTHFRNTYFEDSNCTLFESLRTQGQRPKAIIIACSDSRVDPALILNTAPGDLFVVRNVANLVPPCELDHSHHGTSAALEFAVCSLEVPHIIIMGHSSCGGINALVQGQASPSSESFIGQWMTLAEPALRKMQAEAAQNALTLEEKVECCALHALVDSMENLYTFPWIASRVAAGTLSIHSWFFNLQDGKLYVYNPSTQNFAPL